MFLLISIFTILLIKIKELLGIDLSPEIESSGRIIAIYAVECLP